MSRDSVSGRVCQDGCYEVRYVVTVCVGLVDVEVCSCVLIGCVLKSEVSRSGIGSYSRGSIEVVLEALGREVTIGTSRAS